ncbi:hypothetical protein APA_721 [Pseudanabaena sp. lw0831]|nr:hypothetical protein APA_721 [Pseudanabaena sp. lw0831]
MLFQKCKNFKYYYDRKIYNRFYLRNFKQKDRMQRFALNKKPEKFLKAPRSGAFKNFSGLLQLSI